MRKKLLYFNSQLGQMCY